MVSTGMLTDAEAPLYSQREDFEGEQVNIVFGSELRFRQFERVIGGGGRGLASSQTMTLAARLPCVAMTLSRCSCCKSRT